MPHPNPAAARAGITALSRAVHVAKAREPFDPIKLQQIPHRLDGNDRESLHLFRRFQTPGFNPDEFTLSNALSISANLNAMDEGKQIHAFIVKKNAAMDVAATNSLINLYFKCESVGDAERVFYGMPERDVYSWTIMVSGYALNGRMDDAMDLFDRMPQRSTVSWNSMISGCQREGYDEKALELFGRMRRQGEIPNGLTFIAVLKACACLQLLEDGEGIHCCVMKSALIENVLVGCTSMDMYAKCGDMVGACKVFSEISVQNVVSWSILVAGYARNGEIVEAERIFKGMLEKNVVSWNVMIAGYVQNGKQESAFGLFVEMIEAGVKPNCFTFTSLLSGCSMSQYAKSGRSLHGYALKSGLDSDTSIGNSMITMYGAQGDVGDAHRVFDMMPRYDVVTWTATVAAYISNNDVDEARRIFDRMPGKNLISWNTMMSGYLQKPNSLSKMGKLSHSVEDALTFFYGMERSTIKPDHFSYNCALTACASTGALEQARAIHCRTIRRGYESDAGVGNALITVYGKCGSLSEAEKTFKNMAKPDMITWNAMLAGYSQNGRGNEAMNFYETMRKSGVDPNHVTFISLLSACSHMGEVKKGQEYFDRMERDHSISPNKEHYACMVDLLGRAGLLHDAEAMSKNMKVDPDAALWGALLGACKMYGNYVIARRAADHIFQLEPDNSAAHIALAETFAAAGMWEDVARIRAAMKEKKLLKEPGCSWIEIRNQKHSFLSGDFCHHEQEFIHATLCSLYSNMMFILEEYVQELESLAIGIV